MEVLSIFFQLMLSQLFQLSFFPLSINSDVPVSKLDYVALVLKFIGLIKEVLFMEYIILRQSVIKF